MQEIIRRNNGGLVCVWIIVVFIETCLPVCGQEPPVQLTVVGPRIWLTELQQYVDSRKPAICGTVVAWEDLMESESGADEPEKIKRFLFNQWEKKESNIYY